jgi:hypothetical protein
MISDDVVAVSYISAALATALWQNHGDRYFLS